MASMFTLASVKNTLDEVRAQVYPRNETEKKVYEALSSKNWGASTTLLNELANDTYDYEKYKIITEIVWGNLNTDGKNWRQVFKTLTFIDFIIKNGAERFIEDCRDRMHKIRMLQDYNFYEENIDRGSGVREKSKQLIDLLGNNENIRDEREKARALRNKFVGIDSRNAGNGGGYGGNYSGGNYGGNSGGSYGGNSGGGYGNSGSESYSSGGRYDSYDSGSRYGGQGSDSHQRRSEHTNSSSGQTASGRYGGGAYDSSRPTRYDDDVAPEPEPAFEEAKVVKGASNTKTTTTGSKLKVNIKKSHSATETVAKPEVDLMPAAEIDLLGGFDANFSAAHAASTAVDFDPFATNAPANTGAGTTDFDPFGASFVQAPTPSAPIAASNFNAFGAPSPMYASAPASTPAMASNFATFPPAAPMASPAYGNFQNAPSQNHIPINNMAPPAPMSAMNASYGAPTYPAQQPVVSAQFHSAPQYSSGPDADFGDFEAAPQSRVNASNQWGDLGSLVDLGKLEKNDLAVPKQQPKSSSGHDSFAGLDGFSKTPQSMSVGAGRPMMMSSQPAMINRSQPMSGGPMGAPMGAMGVPMNGGMVAPAGYGMMPPNSAQYGAPMAPPQMNMYGNNAMGGMYNPAMNVNNGYGAAPGFANNQQQQQMNGYPQNFGMPQYR